MMSMEIDAPPIGDNNPPEKTPFEIAQEEILDLYQMAKDYLDGDPIDTQKKCDDVQGLMRLIQKAQKDANASRRLEAKPFDDGKKEVQEKYNPLIQPKKGKCDVAIDACKRAMTPWLVKVESERLAEVERARLIEVEAQRKADEARKAAQASEDMAIKEEAEIARIEAEKAKKAATKINKSVSGAGGTIGRKTTLRSTYTPELIKLNEAIGHYWKIDRQAFEDLVNQLAARDVRAGKREIPGFNIKEEKSAV